MAVDKTKAIKPMSVNKFSISFSEDRIEEIEKSVEEGNWENRAEYLRHMIRAGESNFAALDPRTSSTRSGTASDDKESLGDAIADEDLLSELRQKCDEIGDEEFVPADEVIQPFLDNLDAEISKRLLNLGIEDGTSVETNGKGEYRINTDQ